MEYRKKKKWYGKSIEKSLKAIQLKFYSIVFLFGILLFAIIQIISVLTSDSLLANVYSANKLIKSDYESIDVSGISKNDGSAQIVTKNLEVMTLTGKGIIKEDKLTVSGWSEYISDIAKTEVSAGKYDATVAYDDKGEFWLVVSFPASLEIQISVMANPESKNFINETISVILIAITYITIIAIVTICYSKVSAKHFVRPIKSLQFYTKELESGNYTKRMEETLVGEYGELQETFYHLAEELEKKTEENNRIESKKNEMLLDISHDLKNPLAAIQGYSEVLSQKKEMEAERRNSYLSAIYQNSHRANEILSSLFSYAQIESTDFVLHKEKADFCEFMRLRILEVVDEIEIAGMILDCNIPEEVYTLEFDREQMGRVVFNLLGNAVKYNKPGTNILITLGKEDGELILNIADDGFGLNTEQSENIFYPFVREDKARNSKTGGSGLGLSIAKKIVEAHDGTIKLTTGVNKGCRFTITLPEKI
ncbi:MAG TPA: HAMP domain-containing sensor histidine kinase [Lachnospiraceae bacterium]|nr:HAMP domain-containing sensor histidine kinase [Lachnospiraceae bacterium]